MGSLAEQWSERLQAVAGNDLAWDAVTAEMSQSGDVFGSGGGGYSNGIPARKWVLEKVVWRKGYDANEPAVRKMFDLDSTDMSEPWVFKDGSGFLLYAGPQLWDIIFLPSVEVESLKRIWKNAGGKR